MGFIGAGLLSGLGAGVTELATQKREDALNALRRQYQLTDAATASAEAEKNDRRDAANKLDQLYLAGSMKQRENESDQAFEMRKAEFVAAQETGHITQRGTIETGQIAQRAKNDMALEKYKAAEAKGLVDRVEVQTDGTPVIIYKGGRREVAPDLNIRETGRSTDSDSGGLIEAA